MDDERPAARVRAGVPLGLLGMLVIVGAMEAWAARDESPFRPMLAADWRRTSRASTRDALDSDVLYLGDSQIKHGVLPGTIEERTGLRGYNLALNRGQAPASYYLLRRALRAGARPKAVVVGFYPGLLFYHPRFNAALWPEVLEPGELFELIEEADRSGLALAALLDWMLPTSQQRLEIRAAIQAALRGVPDGRKEQDLALRRNWLEHRGAQANAKNPGFLDPPVDVRPELREPPFRCNRANEKYIRRILKLTADRRIPVYWLIPPQSPSTRADRERNGLDAPYDQFVAGLQADFPHLTVLDGRNSGYDRTHFIDVVHLDRDGATAFSLEVADALQATGESPIARWVRLPEREKLATKGERNPFR